MCSIKCCLIVFLGIFFFSGLVNIITGALVLANEHTLGPLLQGKADSKSIGLTIAGVIIFIVALVGLYGIIKGSHFLIKALAIALFVLALVDLGQATYATFSGTDPNDTIVKDAMKGSMKRYCDSVPDAYAWDWLQKKFKCCGIDSSSDWSKANSKYANSLPASCCKDPKGTSCSNTESEAYQEGCNAAFEKLVKYHTKAVIGVNFGGAFVKLVCAVLACLLAYIV